MSELIANHTSPKSSVQISSNTLTGWLSKTFGLLLLTAGSVWMLLPLVWMLSASLMPLSEVIKVPPVWFSPQKYTLVNFREVWFDSGFANYFFNSAYVAISITLLQLLTSTMAGFAFARYEFPGRTVIFVVILSTLMIPFQVIMIPLFMLMARLNLVDTYWGLILPSIVTPFGIFLMRQFMLTIPKSLLEAARIDGAPEPYIYAVIMLPLCKPAIAALTIFTFLGAWDDFLWPLVIVNRQELWTMTVAMARFTEQYISQTHLQMAGASIMFLPVLLIFLFMQRNFIEGIALTGLKG
ncbi:MAG TPA: carbohydrate ABC transporter permease [Caldilineaceae bacterium]|nr:carbohydrate ABC transporter permease [Caldilineaceae bacterium]